MDFLNMTLGLLLISENKTIAYTLIITGVSQNS